MTVRHHILGNPVCYKFNRVIARHGYEAATHEAKADALAMVEAEAKATASQRFRSQSRSF